MTNFRSFGASRNRNKINLNRIQNVKIQLLTLADTGWMNVWLEKFSSVQYFFEKL